MKQTELEQVLLNGYKVDMMAYLASKTDAFDELMQLALSDKYPLAWRAAWLLSDNMIRDDIRISPFVKDIIKCIPAKKEGHQRELLKILMKMDLNEEQEGRLFDMCVTIWEKLDQRPSVRHTAFVFILEVVKKYPEMYQEIEFYTQNQYVETLSPGIKNSIQRRIKELGKMVK